MSDSPRTVLITGCSSGIGRAAADTLRERGYRIFATARRAADVERLTADGHESLRLDLTDGRSIDAAIDEMFSRTSGRLYGLFNNGGFGQPGAVEDVTVEALRAQFETNVFGWHTVIRRVLPAMRAAGEGRIVQNSSVLGLVALRYRGAYVASKFRDRGPHRRDAAGAARLRSPHFTGRARPDREPVPRQRLRGVQAPCRHRVEPAPRGLPASDGAARERGGRTHPSRCPNPPWSPGCCMRWRARARKRATT